MTCKYCSRELAPLRSLTDGEFCSDDHRQAFQEAHRQADSPDFSLPEQPLATAFDTSAPDFSRPLERNFLFSAPAQTPPADFSPATLVEDASRSGYTAESAIEEEAPVEPPPSALSATTTPARPRGAALRSFDWLVTAWQTAPSDLKAMALLLPVLAVLACVPILPSVHLHFNSGKPSVFRERARQAVSHEWQFLAERIANRAAIAITDDFRSGLDSWRSRANLTNTWSFDANGFVQPGPLAILKPTQGLRDYSFEFLGEIEKKAVGCAFRAQDLDNYYAVKFIEDNSESIPSIRLVRYAVIKGKEGPHVEKRLPSSIRADMLNRFRVEVHGSDFTILAEGEVVDSFSDKRLQSGGVGFFCSRGEKARLRWVAVSHQYDALGRLCAMLAPVGLAGVDKD